MDSNLKIQVEEIKLITNEYIREETNKQLKDMLPEKRKFELKRFRLCYNAIYESMNEMVNHSDYFDEVEFDDQQLIYDGIQEIKRILNVFDEMIDELE